MPQGLATAKKCFRWEAMISFFSYRLFGFLDLKVDPFSKSNAAQFTEPLNCSYRQHNYDSGIYKVVL